MGESAREFDPQDRYEFEPEVELTPERPHHAADCLDCGDPSPEACSNCHHVVE